MCCVVCCMVLIGMVDFLKNQLPLFTTTIKLTKQLKCKLAGLAGECAVRELETCLSASSLGSEASRYAFLWRLFFHAFM
jgi:hypothetical protein